MANVPANAPMEDYRKLTGAQKAAIVIMSMDEENATKLIGDIFSSIKRTLTKPNNSIFLGTVILHDEKNVVTGVHSDTPNLLTKVANVVDGQQRITSIGRFVTNKFAIKVDGMEQYFESLAPEQQAKILNTKLTIYKKRAAEATLFHCNAKLKH